MPRACRQEQDVTGAERLDVQLVLAGDVERDTRVLAPILLERCRVSRDEARRRLRGRRCFGEPPRLFSGELDREHRLAVEVQPESARRWGSVDVDAHAAEPAQLATQLGGHARANGAWQQSAFPTQMVMPPAIR
jgi:hypothetical protein